MWSLTQTDALSFLVKQSPDSFDAVITDPPYSSGGAMRSDRNKSTSSKYTMGGKLQHYADFAGDNRDQRSYLMWCTLWLGECLRVTKSGGVLLVFTDWRQLATTVDAIQAGGWIFRGVVPWDKTESCRPDKGRFRNQCEYVVWASKGPLPKPTADAPCLPGVFRHRVRRSDKHHIAGKPTALMGDLMGIVPQGGVVFDPFCGSGTTGVAAIQNGLSFVGCEAVPAIAEIAQNRLAEAEAQTQACEHGMTSSDPTARARTGCSPSQSVAQTAPSQIELPWGNAEPTP